MLLWRFFKNNSGLLRPWNFHFFHSGDKKSYNSRRRPISFLQYLLVRGLPMRDFNRWFCNYKLTKNSWNDDMLKQIVKSSRNVINAFDFTTFCWCLKKLNFIGSLFSKKTKNGRSLLRAQGMNAFEKSLTSPSVPNSHTQWHTLSCFINNKFLTKLFFC